MQGSPAALARKLLLEVWMECTTIVYIFNPKTRANPMNTAEYIATIFMFAVWAIVWTGMSLGVAERPPFFDVFTAIVLLIFGRIWGINLAHRAVGLSAHPSKDHYEGKTDETANGES